MFECCFVVLCVWGGFYWNMPYVFGVFILGIYGFNF